MIYRFLRMAFYGLAVRPITMIVLGINGRHLDRLRPRGAHLVAANHNSHLDTLVLMSLFRLGELRHVKVVAAKDYFCRTPLLAWFSINVIGIIPIDRSGSSSNPVQPVFDALDQGFTVIMFPEGSRGEAEVRSPLRFGIAKIVSERPQVGITPVYLRGLGKALPRGEALLVPFVCDVNVGSDLGWQGDRAQLIGELDAAFDRLAREVSIETWE